MFISRHHCSFNTNIFRATMHGCMCDGGMAVPRRVAACMDILVHNVVKCMKCSGN